MLVARAATPTASIEPENAPTKTAPVTTGSDAAASNGSYIKFGTAGSGSGGSNIAIPAYFDPSGSDWTNAVNAQPHPALMVMDVTARGAGFCVDPTWLTAVNVAKAKGIKVAGYVDTQYHTRTQTGAKSFACNTTDDANGTKEFTMSIAQEVANYKAWYGVTDIFFDQVDSDVANVAYYQSITNNVHASTAGSTVILNNGTIPDESYMNVGDIIVIFESCNTACSPLPQYQTYQSPSWVGNYPASKYWHIIYNVPASQLNTVLTQAKSRRAGYIYATDDVLPNPYDVLPTYWNAEVSGVAGL